MLGFSENIPENNFVIGKIIFSVRFFFFEKKKIYSRFFIWKTWKPWKGCFLWKVFFFFFVWKVVFYDFPRISLSNLNHNPFPGDVLITQHQMDKSFHKKPTLYGLHKIVTNHKKMMITPLPANAKRTGDFSLTNEPMDKMQQTQFQNQLFSNRFPNKSNRIKPKNNRQKSQETNRGGGDRDSRFGTRIRKGPHRCFHQLKRRISPRIRGHLLSPSPPHWDHQLQHHSDLGFPSLSQTKQKLHQNKLRNSKFHKLRRSTLQSPIWSEIKQKTRQKIQ